MSLSLATIEITTPGIPSFLRQGSGLDRKPPPAIRSAEPVERMTTDSEHMSACLTAVAERRDRAAFGDLFAFYAPRIKALMMKAGAGPQEAEEVMQEAMLLVWRKAALFDPSKASASTWIYTIARNRRIDLIRRVKRPEFDPEDPFFHTIGDEPDGEQVVGMNQRAEFVRDYLKTLPEDQLVVIRKAFFEDMTHQAIAAELKIPLGTVKSRIRIALQRLRGNLDGAEL
jgi:RNA polymerase sigma-70 factor (ECF subfamily)